MSEMSKLMNNSLIKTDLPHTHLNTLIKSHTSKPDRQTKKTPIECKQFQMKCTKQCVGFVANI